MVVEKREENKIPLFDSSVKNSIVEQYARQFKPILNDLVRCSISGFVFSAGISSAQRLGLKMSVSCNMPVSGSIVGASSVFFSSIAAVQAGVYVEECLQKGSVSFPKPVTVNEALIQGIVGSLTFKALGGRFRSLMPSDLRHPGAGAAEWIPASNGSKYASDGERKKLSFIFQKFGCHHCGIKTGKFVADHMPPTRKVYGRGWANRKFVLPLRWAQISQRFYPQCSSCSILQSAAVKHNTRKLVSYRKHGLPEISWFTGALLPIAQDLVKNSDL